MDISRSTELRMRMEDLHAQLELISEYRQHHFTDWCFIEGNFSVNDEILSVIDAEELFDPDLILRAISLCQAELDLLTFEEEEEANDDY